MRKYAFGDSWPPTHEDTPELRHGRVLCEKFCSEGEGCMKLAHRSVNKQTKPLIFTLPSDLDTIISSFIKSKSQKLLY